MSNPQGDKLIQDLVDLRCCYFNKSIELQKKYGWEEKDARLGVFAKCINVLEPVMFGLVFVKEQLSNPFYQARFTKGILPSPEESTFQNESYIRFLQSGGFVLFFSMVESSMRIFVRALNKKDEAKDSIRQVSKRLFVSTGLQKYENLMTLFADVRNCAHNNGLYMSQYNSEESIDWKGKTYKFEEGKVPDFVNFPFLIELGKDVKEMLIALVESEPINSLKPFNDPIFPKDVDERKLKGE